MDTQNTHDPGTSTPALEDLEAPARDLTAEESGEIQGGGGVILERRGSGLAADGDSSDGVVVPDSKSGGGSSDAIMHD